MTTNELTALIARVENATADDDNLDADLAAAWDATRRQTR